MVGLTNFGPAGTISAINAGVSSQAIGPNNNRNGLIFCNGSTASTVWLVPQPLTAVVGLGICVYPQSTSGDLLLPKWSPPLGLSSGWNAIADTGTVNLLALEFFGS